MTSITTKPELLQSASECFSQRFDGWIDPTETGFASAFIEDSLRKELGAVQARPRYGRHAGVEARRKAFLRNWRAKRRAITNSLEEAGERLFTFTCLPPIQRRRACAQRPQSNACAGSSSGS
jgi:hypothetical protein